MHQFWLPRSRLAFSVLIFTAISVSPVVASSAVEPVSLHHAAASPPVWCDSSTIVYAVKPDTDQPSLRAIVTQAIPGGEPRELFRDTGSAVPYQCVDGRILYWTLNPTDCDVGPEDTRHQAVYVADTKGAKVPLACGAAVALLSPDRKALVVTTYPAWTREWRPKLEGIKFLANGGEAPLIVDVAKPDLFRLLSSAGQVAMADFLTGRFNPSALQKQYALDNGAIRWLSNGMLAVSTINTNSYEALVWTVRLDPETANVVAASRVSLGADGEPIFDTSSSQRFHAWSTRDELRQIQECWLSAANISCTRLALHFLLDKAGAKMATNFDSDVDFLDDMSIWFVAELGSSQCLMRLRLATNFYECLIEHTEKFIVGNTGTHKRLAISPDRKWLAYLVLKDLGWNGSSDLMLLPLPE